MIIIDKNDKPLMVDQLVDNNGLMRRWTEYCIELHNYPMMNNEELIKETTTSQYDISLSILELVVISINTLKNG